MADVSNEVLAGVFGTNDYLLNRALVGFDEGGRAPEAWGDGKLRLLGGARRHWDAVPPRLR